jgi:Cdc6-like AAA superfamily ATPase
MYFTFRGLFKFLLPDGLPGAAGPRRDSRCTGPEHRSSVERSPARGGTRATEAHVDDALRQAEINRFQKLVSGQPSHVNCILRALALLAESNEGTAFRTAEVYEPYQRVAERTDADPLSHDRVQRL